MNQNSKNPYSTPSPSYASSASQTAPQRTDPSFVLMWQMIYVVLMMLMYAALVVLAVFLFSFARDIADEEMSVREAQITGAVMGVMSLGMVVLYGTGIFWRRGNGGWIFQIILIAIGLSSCLTWPITIPLIIGWIKHRHSIVHHR